MKNKFEGPNNPDNETGDRLGKNEAHEVANMMRGGVDRYKEPTAKDYDDALAEIESLEAELKKTAEEGKPLSEKVSIRIHQIMGLPFLVIHGIPAVMGMAVESGGLKERWAKSGEIINEDLKYMKECEEWFSKAKNQLQSMKISGRSFAEGELRKEEELVDEVERFNQRSKPLDKK